MNLTNGPVWSEEEGRIALLPLDAHAASRALAAAGYDRSANAINQYRHRVELYPAERRLRMIVLRLGKVARRGGHYRINAPTVALREAVSLGLVKRLGKTTYRITLAGIAWLESELGPDWEGMGEA